MKIAFYLPNIGLKNVDCRSLENGNPGIGGTEYIIQATAYFITKQNPKDVEIVIGANCTDFIADEISTIEIDSIHDLVNRLNPDYILLKYEPASYLEAKNAVKDTSTKILIWAHNFIPRKELTILANDRKTERIICVSREQLDMYRDHKAFLKSSFVFNGMPVEYLKKQVTTLPKLSERPHNVTYIGSLVNYKGFHILAKAWKGVLKKVPDAKLNVIGSGKLYDRNTKLGKFGIADEEYENVFMPFLVDERNEILSSVKFWGVLGTEKNDILKQTRVGVPNPSGISETFCITALEMQAMGCVVTTIDYGGFKDTVYEKTGLLYQNVNSLTECIVKQLNEVDNDIDGFYHFMHKNFAFEKIAKDWLNLFRSLGCINVQLPYNNDRRDRVLKLRETNRRIKNLIPFGYFLPTIDFYRSIFRKFGLIKSL